MRIFDDNISAEFEHECKGCLYIGTVETYCTHKGSFIIDVYVHPRKGKPSEDRIIARHGSGIKSYESFTPMAVQAVYDYPVLWPHYKQKTHSRRMDILALHYDRYLENKMEGQYDE